MKKREKLTSSFSHFLTGLICILGMAAAAYFLYQDVLLYLNNPKSQTVNNTSFKDIVFQSQNTSFTDAAEALVAKSIAAKEKAVAEELAKQQAAAKKNTTSIKKTTVKKPVVIPNLVPAPLQEPLLLSPTESQIISDADLTLTDSPSLEFEWEAVPRAQKYYFELFDKNNKLIVSKYTNRTYIVLDDELALLADEGIFSWRVTASAIINNKNLSQVSGKQTFSIILDPIAPVVIDKSNLITED